MNLSRFFEHWKIAENPFRGEEARQDPVFQRLGYPAPAAGEAAPAFAAGSTAPTAHSDFEKIAGDFTRPSTSIVFGEKGSGKTAIRLQLAERIAAHNAANPGARCLLVPYDDLNPVLDRFFERAGGERKGVTPIEIFKKIRLVDHIDGLLLSVVPRIADALLNEGDKGEAIALGPEPRKAARKLDESLRTDLLVLQSVYDRGEGAAARTSRLRKILRLGRSRPLLAWTYAAYWGWIPAAVSTGLAIYENDFEWNLLTKIVVATLTLGWLAVLGKFLFVDRLGNLRLAHKVRRQIRVGNRSDLSLARSFRELDDETRTPGVLPATDSDETRYAMLERLRRALRPFGYAGIIIVIDRVDEPTLVSGDPDRMQAVIWPMLNNKFLQQGGIGVKMLLPMELRHALFRESAAFFQEARLDKQNLVERLSWTGAMLYDLCNARLAACLAAGAPKISLLDLFSEDVTRQDLVDALDQMHQPRDAFKMLYQVLNEHCSNVTEDQAMWRIPRSTLESVRKEQAERVRQLYRGVRPA